MNDGEGMGSLPTVLTADEVAGILRVDRKTVYAMHHDGRLPGGRKIGQRLIRFSRDRVMAWLNDDDDGSDTE